MKESRQTALKAAGARAEQQSESALGIPAEGTSTDEPDQRQDLIPYSFKDDQARQEWILRLQDYVEHGSDWDEHDVPF